MGPASGAKSFRTFSLRRRPEGDIHRVVKPLRLLVLASVRGSHAANLIEATRDGRIAGEVVRVVSDRPDASALETARALQQIRHEAVDLSATIASKLLQRNVSKDDNARLIEDTFKQIEASGRPS